MMSEETIATHSPQSRKRRVIWITLAVTLALGIGYGVFEIVATARHLSQAEERLQVTLIVCNLIAEHVESSPTNSWPRSWADLEALHPGEGINNWPWPGGHERVRSLVKVDFNTTV